MTLAESISKHRRLGCSELDAIRLAESQAEAERTRLEKVSPKELSAAERDIEKAQSQLAKAEAALETRREVIAALENKIVGLGHHRELVAAFIAEFSFTDAESTAANVFSAWESSVRANCPQTVSGYRNALDHAAIAAAIRPHVAGKLEALKATEAALIDEILEVSKREVINLQNLLHVMRSESGVQKNGCLGDEKRHTLFARGLLNIAQN